ncbi:MAG: SpoIIE family protein phosphatase, partial [Planctomycetota bacterium]
MPEATLEYDSRTNRRQVSTPTRFEVAMEDERGRWVRRRFMIFCTLVLVVNLLSLLAIPLQPDGTRGLVTFFTLLTVLANAAALVYAWRSPPRAKVMIRVAIWLFILTSIASLAANRLTVEIGLTSNEVAVSFNEGLREGFTDEKREQAQRSDELDAETAVVAAQDSLGDAIDALSEARETLAKADASDTVVGWRQNASDLEDELRTLIADIDQLAGNRAELTITPAGTRLRPGTGFVMGSGLRAGIAAGQALFGILFLGHFISCLFIPWTFRESLFPGLVVFNAFVLILIADIMFSGLPWWAAILLLVGGLAALVPGSLWCFWRYTRFPKVFRTRYEADRYKQLSKDLSGARQIHESVLPPQKGHGDVRLQYVYEPMSQIGGDLIYVRESDDDNGPLSVVLLDVTGHGVAAALTVNRLLGELDRIFGEDPDVPPGKVLAGLNHYVHLTLVRHGVFVTGLALRLEPGDDNGNLRYANAGHPPAFACRGGECERLEPTTFMLGVMDESGFDPREESLHLDAGDGVMIYTDGA